MKVVAFLAIFVLAGPGPAVAQQSSGGGLGSVIDILGGILGVGGAGRVHGHAVLTKGDTLVVRTDDGRTVSADISSVDPRIRGVVKPGDGVTLTLRRAPEGDTRAPVTATDLQLDPPSQAGKTYSQIAGTVTEASASRVVFKTREGMTLPLDVTSITGLPPLNPGEPATLIYEQGTTHGVVAVWIEPGAAASTSSRTSVDTTRPLPGEGTRVHGMVETVSLNGFTLVADDGRRVMVETSRGSAGTDVRPGDYVTVVGRPGDRGDTMIAERVRPDTRRRQ